MKKTKTRPMSTRNAVETAIDLSRMHGTWEDLLRGVFRLPLGASPRRDAKVRAAWRGAP